MNARVANALALGLGCLVAPVLGEVALRVLAPQRTGPAWFTHDPVLGDIPAPGGRGERSEPGSYRFSFTHDAQGLRVVPAAARAVAQATVLVLGDSFTYGLGVNDDETFCSRLQEALLSRARVVNAGNPAKGTDYALRFFLARGAVLHPDVVLLAFTKNDFGDNERQTYFAIGNAGNLEPRLQRDARSTPRKLLEGLPGLQWLLSRSHLVNLLRYAAMRMSFSPRRPARPAEILRAGDGPRGFVWVTASRRELTRRYLAALRDAASEGGASLLVAYVPDARDCWLARNGRPESPDEAAFHTLAADLALRSLSLTPALAASAEPLDRLYFVEGHWTPVAHSIAARALVPAVEDLRVFRDHR